MATFVPTLSAFPTKVLTSTAHFISNAESDMPTLETGDTHRACTGKGSSYKLRLKSLVASLPWTSSATRTELRANKDSMLEQIIPPADSDANTEYPGVVEAA